MKYRDAIYPLGLAVACSFGFTGAGIAADDPFVLQTPPPVVGSWDLVVHGADGNNYPSWLKVEQSGYRTLVGAYVGQFGSARPIALVHHDQGRIRFNIPPQWEHQTNDIVVSARLDGDVLQGELNDDQGRQLKWEGHRAPTMVRDHAPKWGHSIELFNHKDLAGWKPRHADAKHGWRIQDGLLTNAVPGNDLVSARLFRDFKLHVEFRYPKGSNSGIYLRGRHEVQIEDDFGLPPDSHHVGGVYGFLSPRVNAVRPADEWQTVEITLIGRVVTVVLNGERVIEQQTIPGITGGALNSDEGEPGPIMLQGDHGPVAFRKVVITPAE